MCAMNDVDDDVVSLAGWLVGSDVAIYIYFAFPPPR